MTLEDTTESNHRAPDEARLASQAPSLRAILEALPPDTLLPARWLLEYLALESQRTGGHNDTLSAQEFASARRPARTADWVREKCALGWFTGAFKDGGEWRIPHSALFDAAPRRDRAADESRERDGSSGRAKGAPRHPRWR